MPSDDKNFDIGVKITADTKGADQAKDALKEVARASGNAADSAGQMVDKVGNAGEGFEETSHQAMEAAHAMHGAEFAFRGVEEVAASGSISVISLVDALRGLAMETGAGLVFAGIAAAITVAISAFDYFSNAIKKSSDAQAALNTALDTGIGAAKQKIDELSAAESNLLNPADQWKGKLEAARDALKETLDLMEAGSNSKIRLLQAQEKLDLAKIEASDENPERKAQDKLAKEKEYSALIAQEKQRALTEQQGMEARGIAAEMAAVKPLADAADAAKQKMRAAERNLGDIKGRLEKSRTEHMPSDDQITAEVIKNLGGKEAASKLGPGEFQSYWFQAANAHRQKIENDRAWAPHQVDAQGHAAGDLKGAIDKASAAENEFKVAARSLEEQQKKAAGTQREGRTQIAKEQIEKQTIAGEEGYAQQTYDTQGAGDALKARNEAAEKQRQLQREKDRQAAEAAREAEREAERKAEEEAREASTPEGQAKALARAAAPLTEINAAYGSGDLAKALADLEANIPNGKGTGNAPATQADIQRITEIVNRILDVFPSNAPEHGEAMATQAQLQQVEQRLRSLIANNRRGT